MTVVVSTRPKNHSKKYVAAKGQVADLNVSGGAMVGELQVRTPQRGAAQPRRLGQTRMVMLAFTWGCRDVASQEVSTAVVIAMSRCQQKISLPHHPWVGTPGSCRPFPGFTNTSENTVTSPLKHPSCCVPTVCVPPVCTTVVATDHTSTANVVVQVPEGFIILKDVEIEDTMERAAKSAKFWLTHPKRLITSGTTSLWAKRSAFAPRSDALPPLRLPVPPGAVVVVAAANS